MSRLWWFTGPLLLLVLGAIIVVLAKPVPYITLRPGSARSVEPLITLEQVKGGPKPNVEPAADDLLFVTVSSRQPSGIEALWFSRDRTARVLPERVINGTQTAEQNRSFNLQLMTASKDKAAKVALERAGYQVKVTPTGAVITDLDPSFPSAKVLLPSDTIVEADGKAIKTPDDLVARIAAHQPGEKIALQVDRLNPQETLTVQAVLAKNAKTGKAQLGVSLETRPAYTFPIKVDIDSGEIGGPSAGLAFTLALIDRLTPGDLTGPERVAVTGTIELDGTVGPVGGVAQKTEAAIRAGAKLFIVPTDEYADAKEAARGRLQVRQVTTVDGALKILREVGGDPVPASGSDG
ncbi:PDZ domain-containing protein [Aquihabitans sp. G128]|uniref:YlbL family protein n=1 Tax=Aquihabitans sp. G128 TaxID=2849779 RepID=UPI001C21B312|nr:S16 family serine protease [Aquihabitans sp. G128]QXC60468.1 PDZ domain-containing protein [Aquihabitans sp. G128]